MYAVMDGEKVEAMREERGLSRQELAERAGIAMSTLRSVERAAAVRLGTARGVGRALSVDPKSLRQSA